MNLLSFMFLLNTGYVCGRWYMYFRKSHKIKPEAGKSTVMPLIMSYCLNLIRKLQHLGSSAVHQQIIKYHQELSRIKWSHLPQPSKLSLKSVIFNTFELMQKNCNFPVSLRVHGTVNVKLSISFNFSGGLGNNNCKEY